MIKLNYFQVSLLAGVLLLSSGTMARASEMDSQIEVASRNSYVFKNYLRDAKIDVKSEDGIVTLTGEVKDSRDKALAADTVNNFPGVRKVNNDLEVKPDQPQENSDGWIGTKVKAALLFHQNVSGTNTEVTVKDGVVTLTGEADSAAQKDLTAQYASDIDGVKSVNNEITVKEPPPSDNRELSEKIDDASITAQAKAVLLVHRSTSAIKTKVSTKDGIISVEGTAKNAAEKDLVTQLLKDIRGVKDVNNSMTTE